MAEKKTTKTASAGEQDNKTLDELFTEVESKIGSLENDDLSLEDSFERYKSGMELLKMCNERIDRTEKQVLEIEEDGNVRPYDGEE